MSHEEKPSLPERTGKAATRIHELNELVGSGRFKKILKGQDDAAEIIRDTIEQVAAARAQILEIPEEIIQELDNEAKETLRILYELLDDANQ